jgi:hypothetical protein
LSSAATVRLASAVVARLSSAQTSRLASAIVGKLVSASAAPLAQGAQPGDPLPPQHETPTK